MISNGIIFFSVHLCHVREYSNVIDCLGIPFNNFDDTNLKKNSLTGV